MPEEFESCGSYINCINEGEKMSYTKDLVDQYGSIEQAAHAQAAYLHDHGLFHAEDVIDCLLKQRDELLEALIGMVDVFGNKEHVLTLWEVIDAKAAISRALGDNKE